MPAPMAASSRTCCASAIALDAAGNTHVLPAGGARPLLSPQRRRRGLDLRRTPCSPASAGDAAAIGRRMAEIQAAREASPADPRPHRRLDLRQPARPQGLGADRPRRLPRPDARRRDGLGEARQFPDQHRQRHRRRSRGTRRGGARAACARPAASRSNGRSAASAGSAERRAHETQRRRADGRLVLRARGLAGRAGAAAPRRWHRAATTCAAST